MPWLMPAGLAGMAIGSTPFRFGSPIWRVRPGVIRTVTRLSSTRPRPVTAADKQAPVEVEPLALSALRVKLDEIDFD